MDGGVIAYASRTGTIRNLRALERAGWRLMVSAMGCHRTEGFGYAIDNGAYSLWQLEMTGHSIDWSDDTTWGRYLKLLDKAGHNADFAVVPDIPTRGRESLALSVRWLPVVLRRTPKALIAVQNGMTMGDMEPHVGPCVGIFIGGDTAWKEAAIATWGPWCKARGVYCHVGRVNTVRRINLCLSANVDSFDGSSASRYSKTLPLLDAARRQLALPIADPPA